MRIDGIGNRTLGRVAGIHVDVEDGAPVWLLIRLGPLAGCAVIPFSHVAEGADRVWAPYDRVGVRHCPKFKAKEVLAATEELDLCAHWGIREGQGRAAQVADNEGDDVTAVPFEA